MAPAVGTLLMAGLTQRDQLLIAIGRTDEVCDVAIDEEVCIDLTIGAGLSLSRVPVTFCVADAKTNGQFLQSTFEADLRAVLPRTGNGLWITTSPAAANFDHRPRGLRIEHSAQGTAHCLAAAIDMIGGALRDLEVVAVDLASGKTAETYRLNACGPNPTYIRPEYSQRQDETGGRASSCAD